MILDRQNLVSQAQALAGTGNLLATDTIDLAQNRDVAAGEELEFFFQIGAAATGGTSIDFQVIVADDAALTTNVEVIGSTGAVLTAALTAGSRQHVKANRRASGTGRRYLGVRYVRVGTYTTGTATSGVVLDAQDIGKNYPRGYSIT